MDIQLEAYAQRKGLGRHLMRTVEMIARKQVGVDPTLMIFPEEICVTLTLVFKSLQKLDSLEACL